MQTANYREKCLCYLCMEWPKIFIRYSLMIYSKRNFGLFYIVANESNVIDVYRPNNNKNNNKLVLIFNLICQARNKIYNNTKYHPIYYYSRLL